MTGFTKLHRSILDSSVWDQDHATRVVWVTFLAMSDPSGNVIASQRRQLSSANVSKAEYDRAIEILTTPDPESKSPEHDGRRILPIPGGWHLVTYAKHRANRDPEKRREQNRLAKQRQREKEKVSATSAKSQPKSAQGEEDEEAEADLKHSFPKEGARALDLSSSVRFAEALEKAIPPCSKGDRTALLHVTQWLMLEIKAGRRDNSVFPEVLSIAASVQTAQKPIAAFFSQLRQEIGYNAKAEAQKRQ